MDPKKVVTWPHAEGLARLAFSPDGLFVPPSSPRAPPLTPARNSYLYTSGSEGYMRVFDADLTAETPFDPKLIEYWEEPITCLSVTVRSLSLSLGVVEGLMEGARTNSSARRTSREKWRCTRPVRTSSRPSSRVAVSRFGAQGSIPRDGESQWLPSAWARVRRGKGS